MTRMDARNLRRWIASFISPDVKAELAQLQEVQKQISAQIEQLPKVGSPYVRPGQRFVLLMNQNEVEKVTPAFCPTCCFRKPSL